MSSILPASGIDLAAWAAGRSIEQTAPSKLANLAADRSNSGKPDSKTKDVGQQFEAMYLRQMLDEFMPKDFRGVVRQGNVWNGLALDACG